MQLVRWGSAMKLTRPVRIIHGVVYGLAPHDAIPWVYCDEAPPKVLERAAQIVQRRKEVDDANE